MYLCVYIYIYIHMYTYVFAYAIYIIHIHIHTHSWLLPVPDSGLVLRWPPRLRPPFTHGCFPTQGSGTFHREAGRILDEYADAGGMAAFTNKPYVLYDLDVFLETGTLESQVRRIVKHVRSQSGSRAPPLSSRRKRNAGPRVMRA